MACSILRGECIPWTRLDLNVGYFIFVDITVGNHFLGVCG